MFLIVEALKLLDVPIRNTNKFLFAVSFASSFLFLF
jgi:hypothetical protein